MASVFTLRITRPTWGMLAILPAVIVAAIPIFNTGGDVWAETFAEYFDCIKYFHDIKIRGFGNYFTALPQIVSAVQWRVIRGLVQPEWTARFVSSGVLLVAIGLTARRIYISDFKKEYKLSTYFMVLLYFFLLSIHPSLNTIITVGYFLFLPFLLAVIASLGDPHPMKLCWLEKAVFIFGLITKPSLYFAIPALSIKRNYVFRATAVIVGLFQIYIPALGNTGSEFSFYKPFHIFIATLGALGSLIDYSFFGSIFFQNIQWLL